MAVILLNAALISSVAAHFSLTWPPSRAGGAMSTAGTCQGLNPDSPRQNGTCLWFNDGCLIGCDRCDGSVKTQGKTGCNPLSQPIQPTLPKRFWSWPDTSYNVSSQRHASCGHGQSGDVDPYKFHPWRAPGTAPVESPCGLAGGYYKPINGFPGNGGYPPLGVQHGFDGRNMPPNEQRVLWLAGSQQEVSVSVNANHGGGYAYRLCPKASAYHEVTEECFRRGHLRFVGETQWVQWGADAKNRTPVKALRVTEGTHPQGSQWTRFPLPACGGSLGGDAAGGSNVPGRIQAGEECNRTQFPPPIPGLFGYGATQCVFPNSKIPTAGLFSGSHVCTEKQLADVESLFNVNFVDLVEIPHDLPAGDYVLSWRHDSEQTAQVWATCADIKVTAPPIAVV